MTAKLTPARRRGLAVLAAAHPGCTRESNVTSMAAHYVYWQTAKWLVDEGLVYYPSGSHTLMLTAAGVELARNEGLL